MRAILAALLLACACTSGAQPPADGAGGGGGGPAPTCLPCDDEPTEDCGACWRSLLACCWNQDERAAADATRMAQACEGIPSCRACCNECAARSCEDHRALGNCPNL